MYLTQIGKTEKKTDNKIEFEKVADDLLMVSINNDANDQSQVFSYWRLSGNGGNPPLEIGVNTQTSTVKSITFFVDLDCFKEFQISYSSIMSGNILVDVSIFSKENDYIKNKGDYFVNLDGNKFMCKFDGEYDIKEAVINENIQFYTDSNARLQGFAINNLTDTDIETIKSLI